MCRMVKGVAASEPPLTRHFTIAFGGGPPPRAGEDLGVEFGDLRPLPDRFEQQRPVAMRRLPLEA